MGQVLKVYNILKRLYKEQKNVCIYADLNDSTKFPVDRMMKTEF